MTSCKKARALVNQASALQKPDGSPILTHVYNGQMDGMQRQEDFTNINATWSSLDCVIYTSTVEAGISFEIPNHFDAIIGISNIKTGVHVKAFAQMLYQIRDCPQRIISLYNSQKSSEIFQEPNRSLIRAELSALRPIDLPTAVKGYREWDKIADCYALNVSPAVETYIEAEYQRRLSAKYFPEILCSLVFSTGASLEIISTEDTIADRKMVSNIIKAVEENIKGSDAELIANAPDITPDDAEVLKQIPTRSFTDNMILQRHYLWRIYASGDIGGNDDNWDWGMDDAKWINLCNISFVKKFNNPEPLRHFRRLAYFRRQGSDAIKALEGLKTKETIQWEDSHISSDPSSIDLRKAYLFKQWKAIQELFQILGFTGIDDIRTLSGNIISEAFTQSCERFMEIRNQSLLLFGFKSRAKETPDLKSAIKAINAIAGNWCGYTVKSDKKRIGPKGQQVWQYSYQINRRPYNGTGFGDKDRANIFRTGIKMSGTSFRTPAPFPTNRTISLDVLANKTTYTRLDDPYKARKCVKEAFTRGTEKRRAFSKEQKEALVPDQRNMIYSVRKRAQEVAKSEDKWDIFINTLDLEPKGSKDGVIDDKEMVASSSNQSRFRKNYALGDPKSKKKPISDSENTPSLVPQLKNDDYNPFKGQIAEIDSMLVGF
ncbi:hypothetical protein RhiirA4_513394 [Rhizophagus irregularis]|uniref:Replication origin-binding protein domain-containing protein n=1 Tax=Rhizophagus irregularis TaxID=588596 RepID=A0A2I1HIN3_9GLOM|nr:hypothetical protein RhiirA4_513394 [Rhizophagus irregularis]